MKEKCEVKGCGDSAGFIGFNHKFCWKHYAAWMTQFKFVGDAEKPKDYQFSLDLQSKS